MLRYTSSPKSAPVAQRLDRPPVTREATGSTPVGRATDAKPASTKQVMTEYLNNKAYLDGQARATVKRGRPPAAGKKLLTLRLSEDVIEKFRATGKGWQARIDEALRKAVP